MIQVIINGTLQKIAYTVWWTIYAQSAAFIVFPRKNNVKTILSGSYGLELKKKPSPLSVHSFSFSNDFYIIIIKIDFYKYVVFVVLKRIIIYFYLIHIGHRYVQSFNIDICDSTEVKSITRYYTTVKPSIDNFNLIILGSAVITQKNMYTKKPPCK